MCILKEWETSCGGKRDPYQMRLKLGLFWLAVALTCQWVECYQKLGAKKLRALKENFSPSKYLDAYDKSGYLEPVLKVRVSGTKNSTLVRSHFISFFDNLDTTGSTPWTTTLDQFYANTPIQRNISFTNVIVSRDPPSSSGPMKRLTLVAHYDSKITPEGFIGATDSAVPCALLMYTVAAINEALNKKWTNEGTACVGIQVIFTDGEEAFGQWTDDDSLYGARHLADKMGSTIIDEERNTQLEEIDTFVLLDLLGARDPIIGSYFESTNWMFEKMIEIEHRLRKLELSKLGLSDNSFFYRTPLYHIAEQIGDDHIPFLKRGVQVLHIFPVRMPTVWHTIVSTMQGVSLLLICKSVNSL